MNVDNNCSSLIEHELNINGKKFKLRAELVNEKRRIVQRGPWKWLCFLCKCSTRYKRESHLSEVRSIDDQSYTIKTRVLNGKVTDEVATGTTMSDEELAAFKKEWYQNFRPGFYTEIITRPFDVLIPVFNDTILSKN